MPGRFGEILPEEATLIRSWIDERWTNRKCPACGQDNWSTGNHFLKDLSGSRDLIVGPSMKFVPYVAFFCQHCGFAMRFNAVLMGVYLANPSSKPEQKNDGE